MSEQASIEQFNNDDAGYRRWTTDNPHGFVVNSQAVPKANYLKLHRSSCKTINKSAPTNWTTSGYLKTCSVSVSALEEWADREVRGKLDLCPLCKPSELRIDEEPINTPSPVPTPSVIAGRDAGSLPDEIETGCPELDLVWRTYSGMIVDRSQILIPDTDADLTWHAFLGHSIDMQGFRAAEFVGVDPLTRNDPKFVPLKERGIGVSELASLWEIHQIQSYLLTGTKGEPLEATLEVLRSSGGEVGSSLAEAFEHFPWRKFHWCVRALLQNSSVLKSHRFSFREWLRDECLALGATDFPPANFRHSASSVGSELSIERALRERLERTFYMVGPALSAYMVCDWQLWLWKAGRSAVFANFKLDSFHEEFVKKYGRGVIPAGEVGFAEWWLGLYPTLPPRLANECIWLGVNDGIV